MTKVQLHFRLLRPLDDSMMAKIVDAHAIYGIQRIELELSQEEITVEYDASRLTPADVEAALARAGVPVTSEK
jgi:hypothetical protein